MKTPTQNFSTLTLILLSASFLVPPLAGLAQTTNQVLSLDGSGDYVSIPSASELQNPTEITVEAWVRPDPAGGAVQYFLSKSDGAFVNTARTYELDWVNSGPGSRIEMNFFVGTSNWAGLDAPAPAGQWVHVAATYRSSDGLHQLFTNGVLAASKTKDADGVTSLAGRALRQTSVPLYLGKLGHFNIFDYARGYMDEVRIWNKARTQAEIAATLSCRLSGSEPNLAGYWNFDAGNASDLTGHGHDGSLVGGASVSPLAGEDVIHAGCTNRVLSFNGSSDYATVTNSADLSLSSGDLSISAWVFLKDYDTVNSAILAKRATGNRYGWILHVAGTSQGIFARKASFQVSGGADARVWSSTDIRTNEWQHIAVVYHSSNTVADLYVDGLLNASALVLPPLANAPSSDLFFGRDSITSRYFWNGYMDEVCVWSNALTSSEIFSKMSCKRTGAEAGLMAYWNCDDGTLTDLTGHGHNGTLFGSTAIVPVSGAEVIHAGCGRSYFTALNFTAEGLPLLTLIGGTEMSYRIDASTNLIDWIPWITLTNQYGTLQVIDPVATNYPRRFYRALKD